MAKTLSVGRLLSYLVKQALKASSIETPIKGSTLVV